jgi:site-specific DNA recombinase
MSPTYSIRRGNRHRYYISRALVRGNKGDAGSRARIGADVERLVVEGLSRLLSRPKLIGDVTSGAWSTETRMLVQDTVERVVVGQGQVQIVLKIASQSSGQPDEDIGGPQILTVGLPAPQPRARKEIIVPDKSTSTPRRISHDLVLAIARAKTWMRDLRGGKYADTEEIAQRFKLNDAHVRRLLRFGYLAPDVVEAIVEGRQPRSLTVKRLLRGIPCAWPDQRAAFGFAH